MTTAKAAGRIIGVLVLLQSVGSGLANFVLMAPVFAAPGFLENAAGHSQRVSLSALLGLATGMLWLGIAITAFQVFRQRSHALALWFVALAVICATLVAVENIHVMSMLSLSEAYAKANVADRDLFQALRGVVASARHWTHYISLIVAGSTLVVLYGVLLRFALVPRALAAFGLAAAALMIIAVAMPLFGLDIVFLLIMPLGLSQLMLALWLIAKGLPASEHQPDQGRPASGEMT